MRSAKSIAYFVNGIRAAPFEAWWIGAQRRCLGGPGQIRVRPHPSGRGLGRGWVTAITCMGLWQHGQHSVGRAMTRRTAMSMRGSNCTWSSLCLALPCRNPWGRTAHATQAAVQDVLEQAPEEVDQRQGSVGGGPCLRIAIAERDQALVFVESDQVVFADHAAIQVARQVLQCGFAVADAATVDHPLRWQTDG